MDLQNLIMSSKPFHIYIFFIIFFTLAKHTLSLDNKFQACMPRTCGDGLNISYPFWIPHEQESFCGLPSFEVICRERNSFFSISNVEYIIKDIFYANYSLLVANAAAYKDTCPAPLHNISTHRTQLDLSSDNSDFSIFYNCTSLPDYSIFKIECASNSSHLHSFAVFHKEVLELNYSSESCQSLVDVPVDVQSGVNFTSLLEMNHTEIMKMGFLLNWSGHNCSTCQMSGGRCGLDNDKFVCFCQGGPHYKTCNDAKEKTNWGRKIGIGVGAAIGGVIITCIIFFICQKRYKKKYGLQYMPSSFQSRNISSGHPSSTTTDDPEMGSKYFGVHLFTYTELEEATNNFDSHKELGDGGFGIVYYGKLRDGRAVAVKRLYENNYKRVEQFMNEVVILTRLRHRHLVSLYGSTSRHSRELVLVYEYVPNGTVADHLHGERAKPGALPWPTRLNIAIETASALTYLHASAIIHRDVKTNNILLDDNFCVKVADFGLSRLFPTDVTHVSTAPQGTPGYVDPEYHECYQLTEKSDVFSFGVVLIELISSMPAVDITRHRHEINLSNMAVNKIQNKTLHELVDKTLGFESDSKVKRTITAVAELAFQCLQHDKESRPSMAELLEELNDIREKEYIKHKTEEVDVSADDAALLKTHSHPLSPDSALNWIASSTTSTHST
ncbi:LEAF RUST 10 DISEASE-RESISTANCE LOCUS RECEPTOR-LIKE PROTEIN KINASE-like 1.2 isoform X4 [Juglans regia]|uniref:non-specific serine/threonine protein kinase n=1 Tax=Juglans regia TaxID=51240 RepID=A0A6P9EST5_JUGRE|nr:LEAF RUST 10 DISEASE-RESISTANCE LOCUS RECEPTOR-LIKE PROTEIN KINASE-like 1.2 isoform X4 [Juglans regia]